MLETKRGQFSEIRKSLKNEREVQLVDFVKKSIKYQELLDINDSNKKRLPTLNSKVGEVKKMSVTLPTHHATSYHLSTEVQPHLNLPTPPTREGHSTLVYNNSALVLGGHCSYPFPTGHVYSLSSNSWVRQFNLPSARSYHSTVLYKDRYAVVFGGMGPYDISRKCRICYNSVNLLDLQTYNTRILKMRGEGLVEARRSHACVLMGKYMLVFGGINTRR